MGNFIWDAFIDAGGFACALGAGYQSDGLQVDFDRPFDSLDVLDGEGGVRAWRARFAPFMGNRYTD